MSAETGFGACERPPDAVSCTGVAICGREASCPSDEGRFASMIASELAMATNFTGIDHISKIKAQASCVPCNAAAAQSSPDRRDAAPKLAIISPLPAAKPEID
jgi:hypothetical protein